MIFLMLLQPELFRKIKDTQQTKRFFFIFTVYEMTQNSQYPGFEPMYCI